MAASLLPLVALAALGYLFVGKGGGGAKSPGTPTPGTGPVPGPSPTPHYDANLPAQIQAAVDRELAYDSDPDELDTYAAGLLPMYPIAAGMLQAKANSIRAGKAPPPSPPLTPAPPVQPPPPSPPVIVSPAPPAPPDAPPVPAPPPAPITVTPTAPVDTGSDGGASGGGGSTGSYGPTAWNPNWPVPDPTGVPIPGSWTAQSQETADIQAALNNWASEVQYPGVGEIPLTTDGQYGPHTQQAAASFQQWANAAQNAGLTVDGLAGRATQPWLAAFIDGSFTPSGAFATDGGY